MGFELGDRRWLFNTLACAPAHLPEVCLEPGGFLEDRDQLYLAGWRGVEIGEMVQLRPRSRCDLLVWHAGVLGDPDAIGIRRSVRIGARGEPRCDLRVTDHA